jgi:hypothetical protein
MRVLHIFAFACVTLLVACAPSSHIVTGTPRAAISPSEVKIYTAPPAEFQEIALLDAHSSSLFGPGGQKSIDEVIDRLKGQAAQLGANGIILGDVSDRQTGSVGTGVRSDAGPYQVPANHLPLSLEDTALE